MLVRLEMIPGKLHLTLPAYKKSK